MTIVEGIIEGDEKVLNRLGFKIETDYMELPRCDRCIYWTPKYGDGQCNRQFQPNSKIGALSSTTIITTPDFGCVQYEDR